MNAVCLKCGSFKENAWEECPQCKHCPTELDKAQHLLLSTHFNPKKKLDEFSECIKNGKEVEFKEKDLQTVKLVLAKKDLSKNKQRLHMLKLWGVFVLSILMIVAYYFIRKKLMPS